MKLSIGIVGLPNVGKSTLFKILTSQNIVIANYPFATIDPNIGIVPVVDDRIDKLAELSKSAKKIPAVVEFFDIAGLVKGASQGEGLGNQFLSHIRETEAIVMVLRVFKDDSIIHVENSVDALRDLEILLTELCLKDLDAVNKRLDKLEGETRSGDKKAVKNLEVIKIIKAELEKGNPVFTFKDEEIVKELQLLTAKRPIFLLNGNKEDVDDALIAKILGLKGEYLISNLAEVESVSELTQKAYKILELISFFTTGEDETRAWTIKQGSLAPKAAGAIHTDFENKFIRAEVIHWDKLLEAGGWTQAKQKGWIRLEGKEYEVKDGDVLVIRHG